MLHMCNYLLNVCDTESPCPLYDMEDWMDDYNQYVESCFPPDEIDTIYMNPCNRFIQDIFRAFMAKESSGAWAERSVEERLAHVNTLAAYTQVSQRTPEWYKQSKTLLTASEFSNILGTPRAVANLALQKIISTTENNRSNTTACCTPEMGPFDWGIRFEPVVKQILEKMDNIQILEMGRLIHPENSRLAASPDGIIIAANDLRRIGRLLEIKCPISRKIDGTIPQDYWCQMQIQMEVANIDECDYIEMSFESGYKTHAYTIEDCKTSCSSELYDIESGQPVYCGNIWLLQNPESLELKYVYTDNERNNMECQGWCIQEIIPWFLKRMFHTTVIRNRDWYLGTLGKQEEFWARVEDARKGLIEPPKRRQEKLVVQVCKIVENYEPPPTPASESTEDRVAVSNEVSSTDVEKTQSSDQCL